MNTTAKYMVMRVNSLTCQTHPVEIEKKRKGRGKGRDSVFCP